MGRDFSDKVAKALREWAESVQPSDALPTIWARIRRHEVKRYIAHFIRTEATAVIVSVDLVFESADSEINVEDWAIAYGNTHFPDLALDNMHEVNR